MLMVGYMKMRTAGRCSRLRNKGISARDEHSDQVLKVVTWRYKDKILEEMLPFPQFLKVHLTLG